MDAKQRYRKRLKVQTAMARLLEMMASNWEEQIPPDETTALMAWQVVHKLLNFIHDAGLDTDKLPLKSDLSRFEKLLRTRRRNTQFRYRRFRRHRRRMLDEEEEE